uniref:Berberine/berberine-like protein n=1 Tax=Tanacetum cinerariifolium TaxID=118510 RepID=A0A699H179_TANCI|nr:berberine/berberine-like protein [Tanacetum cinerariifolium]
MSGQIRIRSGGHDYEGLSYTSFIHTPFIILDLNKLRSVTVDSDNKTAWVESGPTIGELLYTIAQKSDTLGFPVGECPTVGIGGHFSGGGYAMLARKYGLVADNVIDTLIVDVNGLILERGSMGEDLFWAIRGSGGASFGVILAWKINLVYVPLIVTVFSVTKERAQGATQLLNKWHGESVESLHERRPWPTHYFKVKSDYVKKPIPNEALERFLKLCLLVDGNLTIFMEPHGGMMSKIAETNTPYPHRAGNLYIIQYIGWTVEGFSDFEKHIASITSIYDNMRPFMSRNLRAAYVNFRDIDLGTNGDTCAASYLQATKWGSKYFWGNFRRLAMVKVKVDPMNFFCYEQSIPPLVLCKEKQQNDDVDINTLTMEQYLARVQDDIRPGVVKPKIGNDVEFEIDSNFMKELRRKLFKGTNDEDANEHVRRCTQHDLNSQHKVHIFYNRLDSPTCIMLDSKGFIPFMIPAQALKSIQVMIDHSHNWYEEATTKERFNDSSDNADTKKLKENIHAIQVSCKICEEPHLTKECPLKKVDMAVEQSKYIESLEETIIKYCEELIKTQAAHDERIWKFIKNTDLNLRALDTITKNLQVKADQLTQMVLTNAKDIVKTETKMGK